VTAAGHDSPSMLGGAAVTRARWRRRPARRGDSFTSDEIDRVRAVLYLSGLGGDDLEDAVQEVLLRALERAPDELRSRAAWASVVAANLARDWHRRAGRDRALRETLGRLAPIGVNEPDLALKSAVAIGLSRLEPDLRLVVILRFYVDLPVREVAGLLGVPEGTVKSRLHRAVSAMRELLPRESVM